MKFNNFCKHVYIKNNIVVEAEEDSTIPTSLESISPYQTPNTNEFIYTLEKIERAANGGDGASKVLLEALQSLAAHVFDPKTTKWDLEGVATALANVVPGMRS